jgi:hypothetical protein
MDIETMFSQDVPDPEAELRSSNREFVLRESLPATGDFERLVRLAEPLVGALDDVSSPEWEASPIGWIRQVSSAVKRGKIGEALVAGWARSEGLQVQPPWHRGHDLIVEGIQLEVKTSLRWNNDRFVFLQLRDFDYQAVALLGLEPNDVKLWIIPKQLLWEHANEQLRGVSHEGSKWLSFPVNQPPSWLARWGGSFAEARDALNDVAKYRFETQREIAECESWLKLSTDIDWPWQLCPPTTTDNHPEKEQPCHPPTSTASSSLETSPPIQSSGKPPPD